MSIMLTGIALVAAGGLSAFPHLPPLPHLTKAVPMPNFSLSDFHVRKTRVAGWTLIVYRDSFTNLTTCRLSRQNLSYESGRVVFQFKSSTDTSRATYRIDNGPALVAVAPLDTFQTTNLASLENPTGGRVSLAATDLAAARQVAIRPRYASKAKTFKLKGLPQALAQADARGCPR